MPERDDFEQVVTDILFALDDFTDLPDGPSVDTARELVMRELLAYAAHFNGARMNGTDDARPTHVCFDCGALGYAGGYHDHGNGEAGETIALSELPGAIHALQSEAADSDADALRDLIANLWLYIGRHAETQLTTEQKELLADVVEAHGDPDDTFEYDRWWRA